MKTLLECIVFLPSGVGLMWGAYIVDRIVGDPQTMPHPVVGMGKAITALERIVRPFVQSARAQRAIGALCVALLVLACYTMTAGLIRLISWAHPTVGWLASVWIASSTIAAKGLQDAAHNVIEPLARGDLVAARRQVARIVGRDTDNLADGEVLRATIETVAENTVDAIMAPLFYTLLGGAPAAIAYRVVNTLDSMWGYRNAKYEHFGWGAARLDDLVNWVPARITGLLIPWAAAISGADSKGAWRTMWQDAKKHPSPNGGIPEAGVAGALGIRLGGWNIYDGQRHFRAHMGEAWRPKTIEDVRRTIRLMHGASWLFLLFGTLSMGAWTIWVA